MAYARRIKRTTRRPRRPRFTGKRKYTRKRRVLRKRGIRGRGTFDSSHINRWGMAGIPRGRNYGFINTPYTNKYKTHSSAESIHPTREENTYDPQWSDYKLHQGSTGSARDAFLGVGALNTALALGMAAYTWGLPKMPGHNIGVMDIRDHGDYKSSKINRMGMAGITPYQDWIDYSKHHHDIGRGNYKSSTIGSTAASYNGWGGGKSGGGAGGTWTETNGNTGYTKSNSNLDRPTSYGPVQQVPTQGMQGLPVPTEPQPNLRGNPRVPEGPRPLVDPASKATYSTQPLPGYGFQWQGFYFPTQQQLETYRAIHDPTLQTHDVHAPNGQIDDRLIPNSGLAGQAASDPWAWLWHQFDGEL